MNNDKIIIAGSTWEKDHILLASLAEKYTHLNWIVVPHQVDSTSIEKCVAQFNNATTLTSFAASHQKFNNAKVIIVDQIGLLRNLYQHAFITYIGGGFGAEGIHNVLEPAAFGKPFFWGPNDEKYIDDFLHQFNTHNEKLTDKETGLWVHGWDADNEDYNDGCSNLGWPDKATRRSSQIWARGNGWIGMALADALLTVSKKSKFKKG